MLSGLEIIIERMKTHPEEFGHDGKWIEMLTNIDKHLTEEEKQSLKQGFHDAAREKFNEIVLKTIAGEGVDWNDIQLLNVDYDTMMAYPLEKQKMHEEEIRMRREMQLAKEKMAMEMEREQQRRYNDAAQRQGYGIANQKSMLGSKGIW